MVEWGSPIKSCEKCKSVNHKYTSPLRSTSEKIHVNKSNESDVLLVMLFINIDKGHELVKTFAHSTNTHSISEPAFRNTNEKVFSAYKNSVKEEKRYE